MHRFTADADVHNKENQVLFTQDHQNGSNTQGLRRYPKGTVPAHLQQIIKGKN